MKSCAASGASPAGLATTTYDDLAAAQKACLEQQIAAENQEADPAPAAAPKGNVPRVAPAEVTAPDQAATNSVWTR